MVDDSVVGVYCELNFLQLLKLGKNSSFDNRSTAGERDSLPLAKMI